jgi:hypothetical protein
MKPSSQAILERDAIAPDTRHGQSARPYLRASKSRP